jgi:alpha-beta hydrolase superfamily lysophospholipase
MSSPTPPDGDPRELVVLAHGMGRTPVSMWTLGRWLRARGYRVVNWGYSSYTQPVAALGERLARDVAAAAGSAAKVHFVGHSLGTVLIRWVIAHEPPPNVGRAVLLAPPNRGSARADAAMGYASWLLPPLADLRTSPEALAPALPLREGVQVGIIAGERDTKVRVAETYLDGAAGHVVVPAGHTFLMNRRDVRTLIERFLRTGSFEE